MIHMGENKEIKKRLVSIYLTDKQYEELSTESQKEGMSLSSYCIKAIEKSMGKVQKLEPKFITVEPIDIYTDDIREGLNKIGNTAAKLDRLVFTLSQKGNVEEYELQRLVSLISTLRDEEKEFNESMKEAYEERTILRNRVIKKIDRMVKKEISLK